ncbi:MAG: hypothetical protein JRG93_11140 [Deltaproteobacteria bacterium]|nr:hypothetical protein [Deltaproteobacteria bacterium]
MEIDLVCLFRCKLCDARMFERDIAGHVLRHGVPNGRGVKKLFVRGKRSTPAKPGGNWKPMYQRQALRA